MVESLKMDQKKSWINKLVTLLIVLFLLFDLYLASFFLLAKPHHDLYQIVKEPGEVYLSKYGHPHAYASMTIVYISEDKRINKAGYYFYWPIHMPLTVTNWLGYAKEPDVHMNKVRRLIRNN